MKFCRPWTLIKEGILIIPLTYYKTKKNLSLTLHTNWRKIAQRNNISTLSNCILSSLICIEILITLYWLDMYRFTFTRSFFHPSQHILPGSQPEHDCPFRGFKPIFDATYQACRVRCSMGGGDIHIRCTWISHILTVADLLAIVRVILLCKT